MARKMISDADIQIFRAGYMPSSRIFGVGWPWRIFVSSYGSRTLVRRRRSLSPPPSAALFTSSSSLDGKPSNFLCIDSVSMDSDPTTHHTLSTLGSARSRLRASPLRVRNTKCSHTRRQRTTSCVRLTRFKHISRTLSRGFRSRRSRTESTRRRRTFALWSATRRHAQRPWRSTLTSKTRRV